jgi:hypothetical protein
MYVQLVIMAKTQLLEQCLTKGKSKNKTNDIHWYMKTTPTSPDHDMSHENRYVTDTSKASEQNQHVVIK